MRNGLPFQLASIVSLVAFSGNALAQAGVPSLPGATQPSQVGQAIKEQQPSSQPTEVLPPLLEKPAPAKDIPPEAQKISFKLTGVRLKGNRTYSTDQLRFIYEKDLHKQITVERLFEIVQGITNYYRNNGYILSRAILPPQHVKGGIVEILIIEGYIGKVEVTGEPKGAKRMVQQYGCKINECRPMQVSRLEKYMYLANEIPGTQVRSVLAPSKADTGAADLSLVTINKPLSGYVTYDNYGTRYIGPQQMSANITANSFLKSGDTASFTFSKTPKGGELTYGDLNYTIPVNAEGVRWQFGSTRVQTHPLFILQPAEINGVNNNYYTMLTIPAIRDRSRNLSYRVGFNYLDSTVTTFGFKLYRDHLRSLDLGLTYSFADKWSGSNFISADLRQGLPIWGYTSDTNLLTAQTSRPGGRGRYTKFATTLSRVQPIKGKFSAYGIFQGQWAWMPLLAAEQFTFGGPVLGRGYDVAEIIGDRGAAASIELRYDHSIEKLKLQSIQFYAFYDAGMMWNYMYVGGTPLKQSGTSTGFGARFAFNKYVSGNIMWTQVLTKQIAAEELIGDGKRPRVFFSILASL
jgi:hemolysin activation/secretion protein